MERWSRRPSRDPAVLPASGLTLCVHRIVDRLSDIDKTVHNGT